MTKGTRNSLLAVLLSAFVWPGAGQIFNREFIKGFVLIGLTLMYGASLLMALGPDVYNAIPPDPAALTPDKMKQISESLLQKNHAFLSKFNLLVLITWFYSVIDAYFGSRENLPTKAAE